MKGYTFIELLVVFSIMSIIGIVGIASFVSFNNSETVERAASDVASLYTSARQKALSQIKPSECSSGNSLSGYRVVINNTASTYRVDAICGNLIVPISSKKLPPQVSFDPSSPAIVLFTVPNATVTQPATVTINGFGKTKMIIVDSTGSIAVK